MTKRLCFLYGMLVALIVLAAPGLHAQTTQEIELAESYFGKGEFEKALPFYEKFHRFNPADKNFYKNYTVCLIELKDFKEAEKVIKKQLREHPEEISYKIDLGDFYKKTGDDKKSAQAYDEAIKTVPPYADKIEELGNLFLLINEYDRALDTYVKGRKVVGALAAFNFRIAEIYAIKGENEKMVTELMQVLTNDLSQADAVQNALLTILDDNPESPMNQMVKTALLKEVQKNPGNMVYSEMLIWLFIQHRNFDAAFTQAKALDKRWNEPGERIMELARICLDNRKYELAIKCYEYVIEKGSDPSASYGERSIYISARTELLKTMNLKITQDYGLNKDELLTLERNYLETISELEAFAQVTALRIELAHLQAFHLDKTQDAVTLLRQLLDRKLGKNDELARAKMELADILVLQGDLWEPSLLYGQVEKEFRQDVTGQDAKFRNARLSYYRGEFPWAEAQMKVLKASTTKLIANDALSLSLLIIDNSGLDSTYDALGIFARADLLYYQGKLDKAVLTLDSLEKQFPAHVIMDEVLYKRAEIALRKADYEAAAGYFEKILKDYGTDIIADDALFRMADLYERKFSNTEKAMQYYQDLMLNYPGSMYVIEARKRYRQLRGDKIN